MKRVQPGLKREARPAAKAWWGRSAVGTANKEGNEVGRLRGRERGQLAGRGHQQRHQRHAFGCGGTFETDPQRKEIEKRWMLLAVQMRWEVGGAEEGRGAGAGEGREFPLVTTQAGKPRTPRIVFNLHSLILSYFGVWGFVCLDYSFWGPSKVCEDTN